MSSPTHRATEGDLNDHGRRLLETAYRARARPKCAREDFADGYIQALVDHAVWWAFLTPPDRIIGLERVVVGVDPAGVHRSTR